jgi:hypothetical protein
MNRKTCGRKRYIDICLEVLKTGSKIPRMVGLQSEISTRGISNVITNAGHLGPTIGISDSRLGWGTGARDEQNEVSIFSSVLPRGFFYSLTLLKSLHPSCAGLCT